MRRLPLLALALAVFPAHAYVRSTTGTDASGNAHPDRGLCLWWDARQIHYVVNASVLDQASLSGCGSAAAASALTQASFPAWQQPCTDLQFVFDGDDPTDTELGYDESNQAANTNLVVWRKGSCAAISDPICDVPLEQIGPCVAAYNCWAYGDSAILALTHTTSRMGTGQILDADIELHAWDGVAASITHGRWYTCASPGPGVTVPCPNGGYGQTGCIYVDVGNTVTHEAGHVLGLDHTCVPGYPAPYDACGAAQQAAAMYPIAPSGQTSKRTLGADDIDGVCTIYPAGRAVDRVTACPNPPPESSSGCGCSTASPAGLGLFGLALAVWRRRHAMA